MSITYANLQTRLSSVFELDDDMGDFVNFLPEVIDYAEQRIYREVDFLATQEQDVSSHVTAGARTFQIPATVIIVKGISIITPVGKTAPLGTRNRLREVSVDVLDVMWPQESIVGVPTQYAMRDNANALLGCAPDQAYAAEITGIVRPLAMSATNPNTYLGTNFPDLFFAACAIHTAGYQRDYGAASEDPRSGLSWSAEYDKLLMSVKEEDRRRKGLPPHMAPPPDAGG